MSRRRLSSIFASSSSSASSTASTSAPANLLRALPPAYAVFKERLLSGTLGPDDARQLFDGLLRGADPVPTRALNALLSALARAPPSAACSDGPSLAIELFKRMDRCASPLAAPTGYTYNILIDCYRRAHRPDLGLAIFGRLLKTGLGQNVVAYSMVIDGFFKEGEVDKAHDLFREMKKQGISPDVVTYTSTIDGLCKSKEMDKAEKVLQQMLDAGVQPDNITYSSLINGYSSLGMWKESVRMFKDMSNCGLTPCVISCNSFMHALCKRGRIKEAKDIFDSMVKNRPKPDVTSYAVLLHGYATQGCFADVGNMFNLMVSNGITPNHHVFTILIDAFARRGMMDKAILIFEDMRKKGVNPNGHCIHGDLVKANELISEMMNKGIPPPCIKFFTSIINNLCKEGRVAKGKVGDMKEALRIVDVMTSVGVEPDAGRTNTAKKIFHEMIDCGMAVNNYTYSIVLSGLCRNNCTDEAIMLLDKLFAMNIKNDVVVFTTMISVMFKVGRREEAKKLFAAISTYGTLLRKAEVAKAGNYLSKIDENNFAVEASTASLLLSLFSIGAKGALNTECC
ncbi:hypothetical protein GUJ93_ZPchr0020g33569 [Zizania palustris]|uniref:Uncharacterized protein n=1 Tax=Zizania palustris TaxID=103762 RepID=A0A8J5UYC1_ZIZPA|nr:hypothetical protein GUJ93_ZPchr0020g33569 [Zizania palustris]